MTPEALAERLGARRSGDHWTAKCPAHDDRIASLSISAGADGRALLHCHAGCSVEAITAALHLEVRDLFPERSNGRHERVTRYEIRSATGDLVAIHERHDGPAGKRFLWRRPDGSAGLGGLPVADLPLFGSEALGDAGAVVVAEGEKAALAIRRAGFVAAGTVCGAATTPSSTALAVLAGRSVVLWPDADAAGRAHMDRIARALVPIAREIRLVRPPAEVPPGWDAADADPATIRRLIEGAEPWADPDRPRLVAVGPTTYRYAAGRLTLTFREVRTDGELRADVSVASDGEHLFRTISTLSLVAREKLAKLASEMARLDAGLARRTVFAAVEAVLAAEERIGGGVDLRSASIDPPAGGLWIARPFWPVGPLLLIAPGEAGKSTLARALAVSLTTGLEVVPGIRPVGPPRAVLIVAAEDPAAIWHARSIEAICRGAGISRSELPAPIELFDARGRPMHRIARAIAERAADLDAAVVLDSMQALLPAADAIGNARDRDSLFWTAVEMIDRPVLIVGHPNRADAKAWETADDGRAAGTEVNRDRARMVWRASWQDERSAPLTSYRRYRLANRKANNLPRQEDLWFAAAWEFGIGADPGVLRFLPVEPTPDDDVPAEYADVLRLWRDGVRSPKAIAAALGIAEGTAKSRTARLRERGLIRD